MEYSVVVLPEPVGPVTSTIPSRACSSSMIRWCSSGSRPSESSESTVDRWSRMRITTFSPWEAGSVETRRSTRLPLTATRARPSCGRRRSAMSSCAMIFTRDTSGIPAALGSTISCRSTPSMR
jgi:hypothetical protein